ncbi:MAG: prephenate dehydrogenase/arogenate dehydrogenase family protein [Canidatus Methanoxibalbensis ujae]|nr:prephenate dehydrogenase/arogenate dehydrogenase family protein [Candidatus Methanoxibalbensis ujae]
MLVTIIGGAGAMGGWFAKFFKQNGADVRIVDRSAKTPEIASSLGVDFMHVDILSQHCPSDITEDITDTDVLIISVPINITCNVIEAVGKRMKDGTLLMDLTSVKREPVRKMLECTKDNVEILSIHPMFGPTAKSIRNQTVIFIEISGRRGKLCDEIENIFERKGARIVFMSADEHDRTMAVIQGLSHFVLLSYGITLQNLNFNVEHAREMSPLYEIFTDFVGRILHQDPELYANIQMNLDMKEIHEKFIAAAKMLSSSVLNKDEEKFKNIFLNARKHFGNTEKALKESDEIIEIKLNKR